MCEKMQFPKQSILAGFEGRLAGVRSIEGPKTRKRAGGAGLPWILNLTMTKESASERLGSYYSRLILTPETFDKFVSRAKILSGGVGDRAFDFFYYTDSSRALSLRALQIVFFCLGCSMIATTAKMTARRVLVEKFETR